MRRPAQEMSGGWRYAALSLWSRVRMARDELMGGGGLVGAASALFQSDDGGLRGGGVVDGSAGMISRSAYDVDDEPLARGGARRTLAAALRRLPEPRRPGHCRALFLGAESCAVWAAQAVRA